jgi:hypothetical protein
MEFFSLVFVFLNNLSQYKTTIAVDQDEFERQVDIYEAATGRIRFVRGGIVDGKERRPRIDLDDFDHDCEAALINASEYILAVDRQLRSHGIEEEFVWGDGDYDEICSHSMICNILQNFWRWDIDEVTRFENFADALQRRDRRIRSIGRAISYNCACVTPQYRIEQHELIVQQALEIVNHEQPSLTFSNLAGFADLITLSDYSLIELASKLAKAESEKKELEYWRDQELYYSEEDADYLAAEMGEEPVASTKKVSKNRRPCKKVKRCA